MDCEECRELLSEFAARELDEARSALVRDHVSACAQCERLTAALRKTADLVDVLPDEEPPRTFCVRVLAKVDGMLSPVPADAPEIMTPDQLAAFLQLPPEKIEEEMATLPSFEIAGEVRFSKDRVLEWIRERESVRRQQVTWAKLKAV